MDSKKRKRTVLSMTQKVDIINRLKQGETTRGLAKAFNVGSSTIFDIKKNSEAILAFANEKGGLSRKVMRRSDNERVEKVLYQWYQQKTAEGERLTGPMLCETAAAFNEVLGGDPNFRASNGWLARFRSRHNISKDEFEQAPEEGEVVAKFMDKLRVGKYDPDMLYSVGETTVFWKDLEEEEKPASNEKVTVLMCVNSTGTHRLPLFVVAKGKQSDVSETLPGLSAVLTHQKDGWVNREVFLDWYDGHFIPEVQRFHGGSGTTCKVLLVLDQEMSRPSPTALRRHHDQFTVFFVPDSVANNLLPIKQEISKRTIELYREQLVSNMLTLGGSEKEFLDKLGLKECITLLSEAWAGVELETITEAWNKISGDGKEQSDIPFKDSIKKELETPENSNDRTELSSECYNETEHKSDNLPVLTEGNENTQIDCPSHKDALGALDTLLSWMEKQDEVHSIQVLQVKKLREIALTKYKMEIGESSVESCLQLFESVSSDKADISGKKLEYSQFQPPDHEYTMQYQPASSETMEVTQTPGAETQPSPVNHCFAVLRTVNPIELQDLGGENSNKNASVDGTNARSHLREAIKHSREAMLFSKEALKHNSEALKHYSKILEKSDETLMVLE